MGDQILVLVVQKAEQFMQMDSKYSTNVSLL
jgi:hypothetical protein